MRSDVTLYIVAAFFFALTISSAVIFNEAERSLWIISTAVLGALSAGLGYYQRPKTKSIIQKIQTTQNTPTQTTNSNTQTDPVQKETQTKTANIETTQIEPSQVPDAPIDQTSIKTQPTEQVIHNEELPIEKQNEPASATPTEQQTEETLTKVKGIGEKRAAQLNSLGINTVEDLAKASVEDVAKTLKISSKIVAKWVEAAKQQ